MLAFVASPVWWQGRTKILLPQDVKEMVEAWKEEIQYDAEYVDGEVDYKKLKSAGVDFDSKSKVLEKYRGELSRWPTYTPRWY